MNRVHTIKTKTLAKVFALSAASVILAGCGGGSDGLPSFDELEADRDAMRTRVDALDLTTALPTGTATYNGFVKGEINTEDDFFGEIEISTNFATQAVDVTIDHLVSEDTGNIDGTLTGDGTINPGNFTFSALNLAGALVYDGENAAFINGQLDGFFDGPNGEAMSGLWGGTLSGLTGGDAPMDGNFVAED